MEGLDAVAGRQAVLELAGRTYRIRRPTLRFFLQAEQRVLEKKRLQAQHRLEAVFRAAAHLPPSQADTYIRQELDRFEQSQQPQPEEVQQWLASLEGLAFTLSWCLDGQLSEEQVVEILDRMSLEEIRTLEAALAAAGQQHLLKKSAGPGEAEPKTTVGGSPGPSSSAT